MARVRWWCATRSTLGQGAALRLTDAQNGLRVLNSVSILTELLHR